MEAKLKYKLKTGDFKAENWLEYQKTPNMVVLVPASWGNKHALVALMQQGLSAAVMPGTRYEILEGTPERIAAQVNERACLLLGPLQGKGDTYFQAVVEYSKLARENRAREMWGELVKKLVAGEPSV